MGGYGVSYVEHGIVGAVPNGEMNGEQGIKYDIRSPFLVYLHLRHPKGPIYEQLLQRHGF